MGGLRTNGVSGIGERGGGGFKSCSELFGRFPFFWALGCGMDDTGERAAGIEDCYFFLSVRL